MNSELNRTVLDNTVNGLELALASTAVATAKAQNFHWNVTGMAFVQLHALFEEIYAEHFEAQDTFAERIRMLGHAVDGRQSQHLEKSVLAEADGAKNPEEMLLDLASDQERLSALLLQLASAADEEGDAVTNDLAIERAHIHDTFAWKLRAHLA
ncbi:MAG: DNA starvation/stationary phase protection protein [Pseudomonadota bacterium]